MRCVAACCRSAPALGYQTAPLPGFRSRLLTRKRETHCHSAAASSLITSPVLTELVRLSLGTSSVTSAKTIATGARTYIKHVHMQALDAHTYCVTGSHLATQGGPNLLVQYSILCALLASLGTWVLQFAGYIWDIFFEQHIFQESPAKVCCTCLTSVAEHS